MDDFNGHELNRHFNETYIVLEHKTTKELEIIYCIGTQKGRSGEWAFKSSGEEIFLISDYNILDIPDSRIFEYRGTVLKFERHPERQWQRGINNRNSNVFNITVKLFASLASTPLFKRVLVEHDNDLNQIHINLLKALFLGNKVRRFQNVLATFFNTETILSQSIDNKYALHRSPLDNYDFILTRMEIPIAFYNSNKDSFKPLFGLYFQEIDDFIIRNELNSRLEKAV